jgi:hypothetical protein
MGGPTQFFLLDINPDFVFSGKDPVYFLLYIYPDFVFSGKDHVYFLLNIDPDFVFSGKEHVYFLLNIDPDFVFSGKDHVVEFDFLGKDSIRYNNFMAVEKRIYKNVQLFTENKKPGDDLFDRLNTTILNEYLTGLMPGLTAKVFRTYNASITLQLQLDELTDDSDSMPTKVRDKHYFNVQGRNSPNS